MNKEILKRELDLFDRQRYQGAIESSQIIQYRPISSVSGQSTVEFNINSSTDEYIDMKNIFLWMKVKIVNKDGKNFEDNLGTEDNYSPINYCLNTAFDQLAIYLGSTLVSQASKNYNYMSFIEAVTSVTNYSNHSISPGGFVTSYWDKDYKFDKPDPILIPLVRKSKNLILYGRLHGPIFTCNKLLLSGVPISLIFTKSPETWPCIGKEGWSTNDTHPLFKILDMSIFVRKVKISPNILNAHAQALRISKAIYPVKRPYIKPISISSGQSSFNIDNAILGQIPNKIIIGFVTDKAYSGSNTHDPLRFQNFQLTYLALNLNGDMLPKLPYQPDFEHDNYIREYHDLLLNLSYNSLDSPPPIDFKNYKTGRCLYAWNLNSDFSFNTDYINLPKSGYINIDLKFKENLTEPIKLILYAQFDNTIEIDENRNVSVDYS